MSVEFEELARIFDAIGCLSFLARGCFSSGAQSKGGLRELKYWLQRQVQSAIVNFNNRTLCCESENNGNDVHMICSKGVLPVRCAGEKWLLGFTFLFRFKIGKGPNQN